MGYYFIIALRPLFVLTPLTDLPLRDALTPIALVFVTTVLTTIAGSRLVNWLGSTELLRDE